LLDVTPEIVSTAEDFSEEVVYVPVSALGGSPEKVPEAGVWWSGRGTCIRGG